MIAQCRSLATLAPRWMPRDAPPEAEDWFLDLEDPKLGRVRLTGRLRHEAGSSVLLVVVHGIGGCAEAGYAHKAAGAAARAGISCLRINQRGCDRRGEDFYHAGLSADLGRVLAAPELARYDSILLQGYSLGGHVVLRYATGVDVGQIDPRVGGVAAICAPLDLALCNQAIDSPRLWPYRRYVLGNLMQIYSAVAKRQEVAVLVAEAGKIRTLREWDHRIVAPRWGFASAADYYRKASVAPHLGSITVPALLVVAQRDPMVPKRTLLPILEGTTHSLSVSWIEKGGHVTFPANFHLGVKAPAGLEAQTLGWLSTRGPSSSRFPGEASP